LISEALSISEVVPADTLAAVSSGEKADQHEHREVSDRLTRSWVNTNVKTSIISKGLRSDQKNRGSSSWRTFRSLATRFRDEAAVANEFDRLLDDCHPVPCLLRILAPSASTRRRRARV
jgi:hypothetical protein